MVDIPIVEEQSFSSETANGLVLVDFFAVWCGPCKVLDPILQEAAAAAGAKAKFLKVDVEKSQTVASKYSITSVPTVLVLKDGEVVERFSGVQDKDAILKIVEAH